MKVCILTIFVYSNYGNRLQNYAVQEILKSSNLDISTLRLIYPEKVYKFRQDSISLYKKIIKWLLPSLILDFLTAFNIHKGFHSFLLALKNHKWSKKYIHDKKVVAVNYSGYNKKLSSYDYFIVGSDQVWNPYMLRKMFWLDFAPPKKRIACIASIGMNSIPTSLYETYAKGLQGIEHISVREHSAADIIRQISGQDVECFFDPTILVYENPSEGWQKLLTPPKFKLPEKYILCYFLGNCDIDRIRGLYDIPAIYLSTYKKCDVIFDVGEFLYAVANAECILTDSFHGVVFSVLFHKQFIAFPRAQKSWGGQ